MKQNMGKLIFICIIFFQRYNIDFEISNGRNSKVYSHMNLISDIYIYIIFPFGIFPYFHVQVYFQILILLLKKNIVYMNMVVL
jgi:hypothetical protein